MPAYDIWVTCSSGTGSIVARVQFCAGRFREAIRLPAAPADKPPGFLEMYNGGAPPVVWECNAAAGTARPSLETCVGSVVRAAQSSGEKAVRLRYRIPPDFPILLKAPPWRPKPQYGLRTLADLGPVPLVFARKELVAGRRCRAYRARWPAQDKYSTRGGHAQGEPQVWVDEQTGAILRQEDVLLIGGPSAPPRRTEFRVTSIKVGIEIPPQTFEVPRGYTAAVPELFRGVELPPGVRRQEVPGVGIGFK